MARREPKVIAITGASAGVGRAIARRFAEPGRSLALMAREPQRLERARAEMESAGARAIAIPLDVADREAVEAAADRIERELGPIDLWINNAMVTVFGGAGDIAADEYRRVTDVTYLGTVNGTLAAVKHMRPRGDGHVLQIGSALAYRAIPLQAPYCAAKSAALAFTDSLRAEFLHEDVPIDLSMVHLPAINTPQFTWARNKTAHAAQPVPPIFAPEVAAEAVHHVAHNPTREHWVARSAYQAILGQKLLPSLADLAASGAGEDQLRDKPAEDRPDNLFEPVAGETVAAEGPFTDRAQRFAPISAMERNKGAMLTASLVVGTLLAGALAAAQRRS